MSSKPIKTNQNKYPTPPSISPLLDSPEMNNRPYYPGMPNSSQIKKSPFSTAPPGLEEEGWKSSRIKKESVPDSSQNSAPNVPSVQWNDLESPWSQNPLQTIWKNDGSESPGFISPTKSQRSMSFSLGTGLNVNTDPGSFLPVADAPIDPELLIESPIKPRNRSKSSSAIYALSFDESDDFSDPGMVEKLLTGPNIVPDIWQSPEAIVKPHSALYHRRASTQPIQRASWEPLQNQADPILQYDANVQAFREQRRFSHAPSMFKEYAQRVIVNK